MNNHTSQPKKSRQILTMMVFVLFSVGIALSVVAFLAQGSTTNYLIAGGSGALLGGLLGMLWLSISTRQTASSQSGNDDNTLIDSRFNIYNQRYMLARLEEEIARVKTQRDILIVGMFELVYSDNPHMKDPETSNQLLRQAITEIQETLPDTVIFGYDQGTTFIAIMPATTEQEAMLIAQDVYAVMVDHPTRLDDGTEAQFKVIVGLVENNNGVQDSQQTLDLAKRALISAWGARYDSIGFVSGFRTASMNAIQVEIVAFGALGEFAVQAAPPPNMPDSFDATIPMRPDELVDPLADLPDSDESAVDEWDEADNTYGELNISRDDDTIALETFFETDNTSANDVITQPISPFLLDKLSEDDLAEAEEQEFDLDDSEPISDSDEADED